MRELVLFGIGGVIGFIVDAGIVQLLVSGPGWNPYLARLLSFLCAATATWLFNRRYTFRSARHYSLRGEWVRYVFAMCGGFALNYAVYSTLVFHFEIVHRFPALGVAAGSLAGLVVNFASSRFWIYRRRT
jgi:putative flippase GtrA